MIRTPQSVSGTFPQLQSMPSSTRTRPIPLQMASGRLPAPCYSPKQFLLPSVGIGRGRRDALDIGKGVNAALADVMLLSDAFDSAETISGGPLSATAAEAAASRMGPSCATRASLWSSVRAGGRIGRCPVGFRISIRSSRESPLARPFGLPTSSFARIVEAPATILLASGHCLSAAAAAIVRGVRRKRRRPRDA